MCQSVGPAAMCFLACQHGAARRGGPTFFACAKKVGKESTPRHGPQAHDVLQERQAVHARHLHVERHHVGIEPLDLVARQQRVRGGADDLDAGYDIAVQCAKEQGLKLPMA